MASQCERLINVYQVVKASTCSVKMTKNAYHQSTFFEIVFLLI